MTTRSESPQAAAGQIGAGRLALGMFTVLSLVAVANLPVTVLLARSLDPAGYGQFQFLNRLCFIAVSVAQLGLPYALTWAMTKAERSEDRWRVYRYAIWSSVVPGVVVGVAGLALSLTSVVAAPTTEWLILTTYPLTNLLSAAIAAAARGAFDLRGVAAIRLSQALLWLGATAVLFAVHQLTLMTAVICLAACQAASAAVALGVALRSRTAGRGRPDSGPTTQIRGYARRVYLGHTLWSWNVYLDQVVLGYLLPKHDLGLYAVAAGLTLALSLLSTPLSTTAQPVVQKAEPSALFSTICKLMAATFALVGGAAACLALFAEPLVRTILGDPYLPAVPLVQILCAAAVLNGINACLYGVLLGMGAPSASSRNALIGLIANIIGWATTVPMWGATGGAVTSVLSYSTVVVLMTGSVVRRLPGVGAATLVIGVARELPKVPQRLVRLRPRNSKEVSA